MKRQIVIEIDAGETSCGQCVMRKVATGIGEYCNAEFKLNRLYKLVESRRHPECLAAEQKAKEEA